MATFCRLLQEHLLTCNELERIADSLPHNINRQKCVGVARRLPPRLATVHQIEDEVIYRLLRSPRCTTPYFYDLDRLQAEHQIDQDYADEVSDMLLLLASGENYHMEHAGYLLRGFFQSSRRHVQFDLECVIPIAQRFLTQADRDRMVDILYKDRSIRARPCISTFTKIRNQPPTLKH